MKKRMMAVIMYFERCLISGLALASCGSAAGSGEDSAAAAESSACLAE